MYPRLSLPRKSADPRDGRPSVRARGGVEAVVLSMPEICAALKAIYTLAMTVRLNPEPSDFEAATLAMRAEFGLSASKMQRRLRSSLTVMMAPARRRPRKLAPIFQHLIDSSWQRINGAALPHPAL